MNKPPQPRPLCCPRACPRPYKRGPCGRPAGGFKIPAPWTPNGKKPRCDGPAAAAALPYIGCTNACTCCCACCAYARCWNSQPNGYITPGCCCCRWYWYPPPPIIPPRPLIPDLDLPCPCIFSPASTSQKRELLLSFSFHLRSFQALASSEASRYGPSPSRAAPYSAISSPQQQRQPASERLLHLVSDTIQAHREW